MKLVDYVAEPSEPCSGIDYWASGCGDSALTLVASIHARTALRSSSIRPSILSITSSLGTTTRSPRWILSLSADARSPLRQTTSHACASRAPGEPGNASRTNTTHNASPLKSDGPFHNTTRGDDLERHANLLERLQRWRPSEPRKLANPRQCVRPAAELASSRCETAQRRRCGIAA